MPLFNKSPKCPYCGKELKNKPTRKKKCPHCSQYIYVRRGDLLTEKQSKEQDLINRWLNFLERYGATEKMFYKERNKLSKQFGFQASVNDTLWRLMNVIIPMQRDTLDLEQLYLLMSDFVKEEGKDPGPYVQQAIKVKGTSIKREVLRFKEDMGEFFKVRVSVSTCNDEYVCAACRKASECDYEIDDFLEEMPIPRNCESPRGCRCFMNAHLI